MSMKHKAPISAQVISCFGQSRKNQNIWISFIYSEAAVNNVTPEAEDKKETAVPDYPRPTPPTVVDEAAQQVHRNELPPKKEKHHNHHHDKKVEYSHRKTETTQPTRDMSGGNKGQTMGVRIGQPAGKAFGV